MSSRAEQFDWHVAGTGAIGLSLAYRLHRLEEEVALITRVREDDPLALVYEQLGEPPVAWACSTRHEPVGRDVRRLLVATKAGAVAELVERWSPALVEGARIYFLQNGTGFLDDVELPASVVPLFVVNGGFTAYRTAPRHVVQSAMDPIWIGDAGKEANPPSDDVARDLAVLDAAGFKVRWTSDLARHRWEKIGINAIVNALAVIHDCANGELLDHPEASVVTRRMCEELDLLFKSMSEDLSAEHLHQATRTLMKATASNLCSTLQDYRRGSSQHELRFINLALIDEARSRGIEMPVHEQVFGRVKSLFTRNAAGEAGFGCSGSSSPAEHRDEGREPPGADQEAR